MPDIQANISAIPPQSVPPLDTRGGDPNLPPLFAIVWWRFWRDLTGAVSELIAAVAAIPSTPPTAGITVQSVVSGSRILGVVYQNTGTTAMMVTVTLACVSSGGTFAQADAITDATATPTAVVASTFNGSALATGYEHLSFWVLPLSYYKVAVNTSSVSMISWVEWT